MRTRGSQRLVARIVLVTFTPCVVACGGSPGEAPSTTTVTAVEVTTSSAALPTIPPPPPTLPAQPPPQLGKQELRELVAPVALYPDVVLASLLPATTNPDQVHDAARYVGAAEHVDRIPDDRGWDGSVVGLLQFPDVLRWLDANPAWTDEMGQAVTQQQGDVLQAIQDYRHAARDAGNLESNRYQAVRAAPNQDIRIEPARPDVVYVPSYDPVAATQPQPVQESPGINPWIAFGGGALVGALGAWALYSIFDDDDGKTVNNYYGGGRRRIRGYDNYYYARGRRPRPVDWTPRPRPYRPRREGWQQPRRLEHVSPSTRPARAGAPLRPPTTRAAGQAPRPGELRREQQRQSTEERQRRRQETQQAQQQQQRDRRAQRQEHQGQRQQKQEQQRAQRQQRQEQQRAQRQQKQEQQRTQRQQKQAQQRTQRQEKRQQNQAERKAGNGQKPNAKKKKGQQQSQ